MVLSNESEVDSGVVHRRHYRDGMTTPTTPTTPTPDRADLPSLRVRRIRERQLSDPEALDDILAEALIAHVGLVRDGFPIVLPFLCAPGDLGDGRGPRLLLHGSTGGGVFLDAGADGVAVSATVTHLDGIVFARSTHDSSANYRSAMIVGRAGPVPIDQRAEALRQISEHLMPGRQAEIRGMTAKEVHVTQVLELPLDASSVKVRFAGAGESDDDGEDRGVWAGVLPVALRAEAPLTSPGTPPGVTVGLSVTGLAAALDARSASRREALARLVGRTDDEAPSGVPRRDDA